MMSKRKQQVIRYRSNKRSSISRGAETEYFDAIPVDLIINILSRLPRKSIAQLRCVSKLWSSIIRRSNYDLLFPIKSLASPQHLFAFRVTRELFFYSSPQPQNPHSNMPFVTTPITDHYKLTRPICGLVCLEDVKNYYSSAVVFNPITGESLTLPKLRLDWEKKKSERRKYVRYCLGYDSIDKQLKVLRIRWLRCGSYEWSGKYKVLTLGTPHISWRKIECCTLHYPLEDNGICINDVLYYPAKLKKGTYTMVCFDVRSERFSFINIDQDMSRKICEPFIFSLIDYKGKLGACQCDIVNDRFELWVLEDAEEHRWSKNCNKMYHPWPNRTIYVVSAGMIASGEIVLYPCYNTSSRVLYIFYYNLESNVLRRVRFEVPVFEESTYYSRRYTFSNFVEHVTLI